MLMRDMTAAGVAFSVHGDLNGRVGVLCPQHVTHPPRIADDLGQNRQGQRLVELCERYNLRIVNGCTTIPGTHHGFSFFGRVDTSTEKGNSTVDYVLLSRAAVSHFSRMDIAPARPDCSDHAATRSVL